jgi:hypothetical protein
MLFIIKLNFYLWNMVFKFAGMETLDFIKSRRGISKKEYTNAKNELVQIGLYLLNAVLFIGSVYVLIAVPNAVYTELSKAMALVSLVLFIHLTSKESIRQGNSSKQ